MLLSFDSAGWIGRMHYRRFAQADRLPRRSRILRRSGECSTPILAIGADAALTHFRWVLARRIEAEGKTARAA
jgi:hypothetical protein